MNSSTDEINQGRLKKGFYVIGGTVFLVLGAIGIILPILPTTPFLLLSAACYLRGSERMHRWLLNNRWFGSYIRNFKEGKGIPIKGKISALIMVWLTISFSALFIIDILAVQIVMFAITIFVSIYLIQLPTLKT